MCGFTAGADTSGSAVDACGPEAARLPAERSLFIGPRTSLGTRGSGGRFAGHPRELGLVPDDFARQIVDETATALELLDDVLLVLREAALGRSQAWV